MLLEFDNHIRSLRSRLTLISIETSHKRSRIMFSIGPPTRDSSRALTRPDAWRDRLLVFLEETLNVGIFSFDLVQSNLSFSTGANSRHRHVDAANQNSTTCPRNFEPITILGLRSVDRSKNCFEKSRVALN